MKKWQEWTIAIVVMVVVAGVIGGAYWYLTKQSPTTENTAVVSQEERDLADASSDLNGIEDLDLTALETIEKDLQAIDLSSL